jgi:hypothetical protein
MDFSEGSVPQIKIEKNSKNRVANAFDPRHFGLRVA